MRERNGCSTPDRARRARRLVQGGGSGSAGGGTSAGAAAGASAGRCGWALALGRWRQSGAGIEELKGLEYDTSLLRLALVCLSFPRLVTQSPFQKNRRLS